MVNEKKIANIIFSRYGKLRTAQQEIFDDVEFYHQLYRSALDWDETYPWDYALTDPVVFQLLRNYLARLNPEGYKILLESRRSSAVNFRKQNQQFLDWEISEMNKTMTLIKLLFGGMLRGRAYAESGWKYEKAIKILAGEKDKNEREIIMRDIVNRAEIKPIRFQDMFIPNHNIPEIEEQPYIIQRISKRFGEMLDDNESQDKEVWKQEYLDKIAKKRMFTNKIEFGVDLPQDDDTKYMKNDDIFTRNQYVSLLKHTTKDGEVHYIMDENDEGWILNKDTENQFWHGHYPYLSWTPFPEDDEFFSMGIVQPVADLAVAITSALNQFLTNSRKASNPMWLAGKDANKTPDWMFVNRPDGVVRINGDVGQIQQIRPVDTGKTMITARQELITAFERGTSMSSMYSSGVAGGSSPQINRTATGAKIIDQNIDQGLQLLITLFGAQMITKIGEHFLELNPQFVTEEQEVKIAGSDREEFLTVKPEEITANFDVKVNPDTVMKVNPVVKQAQLLNLKSIIDEEKDIKIDKVPVWKNILQSFPEMDTADDILNDPEDIANEAIKSIMDTGFVPEVPHNIDHKTVIQIVQKHMMSMEHSDEQLAMFADYIDECKLWIEAGNPNLFTQPVGQQMLPTNEQDLLSSMTGDLDNPTQDLPNPTPLDNMGGPILG